MKIALLADIHGNAPALECTLDAVAKIKPDKIAVLGDLIGYYYDSNHVVDLVRTHADIVVRGNHERMYSSILSGSDSGNAYRTKYGKSLDLAVRSLSDAQNTWLRQLPDRKTMEICGQHIEFSHEAGEGAGGYLYPDASGQAFDAAVPPTADVYCFGHTHYPFSAMRGRCLLINPGSVGQARDVGGLAQWALLHVTTGAIEFKHTPYDTVSVEDAAIRNDPDLPYLRDVLKRGLYN